jgi:hypothetical protein
MPPAPPRERRQRAQPDAERSWWFTLSDTLDTLDDDAARIDAIASGQAIGTASRELAEAAAELLRRHHERLVVEAERWIY